MTFFASALAAKHGYDFPLESGRFIETGPGQYTREDGPASSEPPPGAAP